MNEKYRKEPFEEHEQTKTGGEATSADGGMPPDAAALDGTTAGAYIAWYCNDLNQALFIITMRKLVNQEQQ